MRSSTYCALGIVKTACESVLDAELVSRALVGPHIVDIRINQAHFNA